MTLTKNQIISIDAYLKKIGVKYWDIRLEMIDHIATQTEERAFDLELLNEKNFKYKQELKKIAQQKIKLVNKKCKSLVYNEFLKFFKSLKNVLVLILAFSIYFILFEKLNLKYFIRSSYLIIDIPTLLIIGYTLFNYIRKIKSIHIDYAFFYSFGVIFIYNFIKPLFVDKEAFFILTPLCLIWVYSGIKFYLKINQYYTKTFKDYLSVCP